MGAVLAVMLSGFITGALARLAVPGPDPMPIWLTMAIGLAGSIGGGVIAAAIFGRHALTAISFTGFLCAILLVIAYRRFVQKRPITGPGALEFPKRGIGIDRARMRLGVLDQMRKRQYEKLAGSSDVNDQLKKLSELHEAGVLTDEEYEAKTKRVLGR